MRPKIIHLTRAETFEPIYIAADKIGFYFSDVSCTFVVMRKRRLFSRRLVAYRVLEPWFVIRDKIMHFEAKAAERED